MLHVNCMQLIKFFLQCLEQGIVGVLRSALSNRANLTRPLGPCQEQ
ncbi:putative signal peptide protein [Puccinia sorghi]|uniref:Putative signal peptide protein n=1 Tax=Puccinia sorghi TaxID=27349 RepID=A0A0L6VNS2_9BASI|nr:putative signal peptide protein [Puccinia sorghi]